MTEHCVSGKVILASTKAVYVLVPLPLERQIQDLLTSHRVEEALILTEGAQRNIPKDKFQVLSSSNTNMIKLKPVSIYLSVCLFIVFFSFLYPDFAQKNPAAGWFYTVWTASVSRSKRTLQVRVEHFSLTGWCDVVFAI